MPHGPARLRWQRSARARSVRLRIDPATGDVVVVLPPNASRARGMALVTGHAGWIAERLAALPAMQAFADGADVPIEGEPHRIRHRPAALSEAWLEDGEIHVGGAGAELPGRVAGFLRTEALRRLSGRAAAKAIGAGLPLDSVAVKDTSSRWGSCNASGAVMFSWRVVMAPAFVQDHVVAHEVAHLRHMNHSSDFHALVDRLTPHASAGTAWLQAHGPGLMRVG